MRKASIFGLVLSLLMSPRRRFGSAHQPAGAEYHAVLFDHGPYDLERYGEDQWTMHDGGCHIGDDNVCMPLQAAGAMGTTPWGD